MTSPAQPEAPRRPRPAWLRLLAIYTELGKLRLSLLVTFTTAAGYFLSGAEPGTARMFWALAGTLLAALGANALNEWAEHRRDALMYRTRRRPVPSGRITPQHALLAGLVLALAGDVVLYALANPLTAGLSLLVQVIYVIIYTPLKPVTPAGTLVGAVTGAIPPLMGFSAGAGHLAPAAYILAAVLFVWQIPHFLALAWMYRDDYERGGYRMLPVIDRSGRSTGMMVAVYTLALVPLVLAVALAGLAGGLFLTGALVMTLALVWANSRLLWQRTVRAARVVFIASIVYLPLVLGLMMADRTTGSSSSMEAQRAVLRPAAVMQARQGQHWLLTDWMVRQR